MLDTVRQGGVEKRKAPKTYLTNLINLPGIINGPYFRHHVSLAQDRAEQSSSIAVSSSIEKALRRVCGRIDRKSKSDKRNEEVGSSSRSRAAN